MPFRSFLRRYSTWLKVGATVIIVVGLVLIFRQVPTELLREGLTGWFAGLGWWGWAGFLLIYMLTPLLMLPVLPLSLVGGALYGLWVGVAMVSLGSLLGAILPFLIARHAARDTLRKRIAKRPRLRAIDQAIEEGGWRIVALVRLSPLMPYNLQNYFYGLTAVRFWPYLGASWLCMLPATFMYVYLGYAAAAGLEATGDGLNWHRLILQGIGLVATVAVTIYVTRLAKRKLDEATDVDLESAGAEDGGSSLFFTWLLLGAAVIVLAGAVWVQLQPDLMRDTLTGLIGSEGQ